MKGVFSVSQDAFTTLNVPNRYKIPFSGCAMSSIKYKVGLGLYSLDIKFNNLNIQFDIVAQSTLTTGF